MTSSTANAFFLLLLIIWSAGFHPKPTKMVAQIRTLFWLYKSRVNAKGYAPIFFRVTVDRKKEEISGGHSVKSEDCSSKNHW